MSALRTLVEVEGKEKMETGESAFEVGEADAGSRLDAVLASLMPAHVSRSRVKAVILAGGVSLNGAPCADPSRKMKAGDLLAMSVPEPEDPEPQAEDIPLDVLYEDGHLIVINKPAGMVVHPA
ncbi:MAG TPA: S4 domain-containing protein, partial [Rhizobiaceae bacterium]|nr:S4 domain-containing protein [Rhizobiaceae bacterium]